MKHGSLHTDGPEHGALNFASSFPPSLKRFIWTRISSTIRSPLRRLRSCNADFVQCITPCTVYSVLHVCQYWPCLSRPKPSNTTGLLSSLSSQSEDLEDLKPTLCNCQLSNNSLESVGGFRKPVVSMCKLCSTLSQNSFPNGLLHPAWPTCCNTTWLFNNNKTARCLDVGQHNTGDQASGQHNIVMHQVFTMPSCYWPLALASTVFKFEDLSLSDMMYGEGMKIEISSSVLGITFIWHSCNLRVELKKTPQQWK